jgi:hypothetical protein
MPPVYGDISIWVGLGAVMKKKTNAELTSASSKRGFVMRRNNKDHANFETGWSESAMGRPPMIQPDAVCDYIQAMSQLAKESGIIGLSNLLSLTSAEANSVRSKLAGTQRKTEGSCPAAH